MDELPRASPWIALTALVAVAGIPVLREDERPEGRFSRAVRATSRPEVPEATPDVEVRGGFAPGARGRSAAWAEVGFVARAEAVELAPSTARVRSGRDETDSLPVGARASIDRAVEALRDTPAALEATRDGLLRFRRREYPRAYESFRRALPHAPDSPLPRLHAMLSQFALGDYPGAAWNLRRALDLLPELADVPLDPRALYGEPADLDDHRAALDSHCRLNEDDREARVLQAYLAFALGDLEKARAGFLELDAPRSADPADTDDPLPRHFLERLVPRDDPPPPAGG